MEKLLLAKAKDILLLKVPYTKNKMYENNKDRLVKEAESYIKIGRLYYGADLEGILRDYRQVCLDTQLSIAGICNLEFIARHVIENRLDGAFVECGTWRGGAMGYWARSFIRNGGDDKRVKLYGFDSFEGMPRMTIVDGERASQWLYGKTLKDISNSQSSGELTPTGINAASELVCKSVVESSSYNKESIHIIKGWFQRTLPKYGPEIGPISVLRLDADFYEATKFCLGNLYEYVVSGGIIVIDDYGCFDGCERAVDEFLERLGIRIHLLYFDYGGRYFFKP